MADNYTDGTGSLVYEGEPKLSPVSRILMDHVTQYSDGSGFYLEEGAYVRTGDLMESLIDYALGRLKDGAAEKSLKRKLEKAKRECQQYDHVTFQKIRGLLREAGVPVNDALALAIESEATHPMDYVQAVIDDPESNLVSTSYMEAYTCSKMRPDEFGGVGYYYSRHVGFSDGSYQTVIYGAGLDKAIAERDTAAILDVVSRQLTKSVDAIRDPAIREQVANALLKGEALASVKDGIANNADEEEFEKAKRLPENLGVKLFNEILANTETVGGIGDMYGQATLVDLMYLTQLLATHVPRSSARERIIQSHGSRVVEFLDTLPNGKDYLKFVSVEGSEQEHDERIMFLNEYRCPRCRKEWSSKDEAQPDDDCPKCGNRHISPRNSFELGRVLPEADSYYVLFVYGDVEPNLYGPFGTDEQRDETAREIRRKEGIDGGGLYWANVDASGKLAVGTFTGDFFDDE